MRYGAKYTMVASGPCAGPTDWRPQGPRAVSARGTNVTLVLLLLLSLLLLLLL
jgi:hypothetical protein